MSSISGQKPWTLFSGFTSVCGDDACLSESCFLSTMVTTSLLSSLPGRMRHLRHLQMPPKITWNTPERVRFHMNVGPLLVLFNMKCQEWGRGMGFNQYSKFCQDSELLLFFFFFQAILICCFYLSWSCALELKSVFKKREGPEMIRFQLRGKKSIKGPTTLCWWDSARAECLKVQSRRL